MKFSAVPSTNPLLLVMAACFAMLVGCDTPKGKESQAGKTDKAGEAGKSDKTGKKSDADKAGAKDKTTPPAPASADAAGQVDVSFLLSMTWAEASKLSPQHLEIPPFYKVAADEVKVLKSDDAGRPTKVRAKGHVFLQVDFREQLISLGQEAYIESDGELIVRGKPLLKRGRSLVEGLTDMTVFYIRGTKLQVIGRHKLAKQEGGAGFDVMPNWTRSWKEGPNPLLPALSPQDVPKELRVNPLLPPPTGDEGPKTLPEDPQKPAVPDPKKEEGSGGKKSA